MFRILLLSILTLGAAAAAKTPVDWVKPQIDTKNPRFFYFSSACRPFGMVNLSPDTKTDHTWESGYRYYDEKIQCFSHIHGWQIAGLPMMPLAASSDHKDYASKFSHEGEIVKAGYHEIHLDDHGVTAELTSTTRVGFHRYTYHKNEDAHLIIDLSRKLMDHKMIKPVAKLRDDKMAIEGSSTMGASGRRKKEFTIYYLAEFDQPCEAIGDWKDGKVVANFGKLSKPLQMKVGLSYTSLEGARANLKAELPHWNFDQVVQDSYDHWNDWLGRIAVEGGSDAQKTKFYTDLWHAHLGRRLISDVDKSYPDNTGTETIVRKGKRHHYNFDALWGAQWSLNVLWPMA